MLVQRLLHGLTVILFWHLLPLSSASQSLIRLKVEAAAFLQNGRYDRALDLLGRYEIEKPGEWEVNRDLGICHYHLGHSEAALRYLSAMSTQKEMSEDPLSVYYMARSLHGCHRFKEAAVYYKQFLQLVRKDHHRYRQVIDEIKRCGTAVSVQYPLQSVIVENLGEQVNSEGDDIAPIQSPNHADRLYFSSSRQGNVGSLRDDQGLKDDQFGHYCADMFATRLIRGEWSPPEPFNNLLNSPRHDILLDINSNGQVLFYFKGFTLFGGQMLTDTFKQVEERTLFSARFEGPVSMEEGDQTPFFFNDSLLLFASRRAGGYGGFDLYAAAYTEGRWNTPVNLGPEINSNYDEVSPFLSTDGRTLYFGANHTGSIGGFDIFSSVFDEKTHRWNAPVTLGFPVNSAGNDLYFRLSKDGTRAYFASDRMDGQGGFDLYETLFPNARLEQLTQFEPASFFTLLDWPDPVVIATDSSGATVAVSVAEPVVAKEIKEISILTYTDDNDLLGVVNTQILQQWIALLKQYPGIRLMLNGHSDMTGEAYTDLYFTIKRVEKIAKFITDNGIAPDRLLLRSFGSSFPLSRTVLEGAPYPAGGRFNRRVEPFFITGDEAVTVRVLPLMVPAFLKDTAGIECRELSAGLSYKVQIAQIRRMLDNGPILNYPNASIETFPGSGTYHYTLGFFSEYAAALALQRELTQSGVNDALVVAYIGSIRINSEEAKKWILQYPDLNQFVNAQKSK